MTRRCLCVAAVLALVSAPAEKADAKTIVVNCDAGRTIRWGLSQLATGGPSVLKIIGTCRENVSISGFHNLEIAANGAELWPAPSGPGTNWAGTSWAGPYVMEVVGSSSLTIRGLTIHAAEGATGILFRGCVDCFVKNCFDDGSGVGGGWAFMAFAGSSVIVSGTRVQGRSGLWISDNSTAWVEGFDFDGGGNLWAGIAVGQAGVAHVIDSVFRHSGVGLQATSGGVIMLGLWPGKPASSVTIQNNSCGGVWVDSGGSFSIGSSVAVLVSDNGSENCPGAGVSVDSGGRASLSSIEIRNEHGPGISLRGQSQVSLGGGIKVTGNLWAGLEAFYDSIALGPPTWDTSTMISVTGTNGGPDLWCDNSSRITGKGHFSDAPVVDCPNFVP